MLSSDVVGGAERSQSAAPRLFRERVCNRSASGNRAHGFTLLEVMVV
ncbi:MAG: prepilin-type N-terminal cleavage/methylation domain-containing protein [Verrucomicrobiae bacterium]|nr:prepilin-type N-terminal cleavage/methylation domain-containing protein [Verrucomicrobiae bacterium]